MSNGTRDGDWEKKFTNFEGCRGRVLISRGSLPPSVPAFALPNHVSFFAQDEKPFGRGQNRVIAEAWLVCLSVAGRGNSTKARDVTFRIFRRFVRRDRRPRVNPGSHRFCHITSGFVVGQLSDGGIVQP